MRRAFALLFLLALLPRVGSAQTTQRCEGQTWRELAVQRYGRAELARLLALYNQASERERCEAKRFVRFPLTIRHPLKLGQSLASVLPRFCSAPGALDLVLEKSGLPRGLEPAPGTVVLIPAELALGVGQRPEAELAEIPGVPGLPTIRAYNGLGPDEPLPGGGTIYVPIYLEGDLAPSAPPAPPPALPPRPKAEPRVPTSTVARAPVPAVTPILVKGAVDAVEFGHEPHRARLGPSYDCALCHLGDHEKPYPPVSEAVCTTCHEEVRPGAGPRWTRLPLHFSHDTHLSVGGAAQVAGYELDCAACHPAGDDEEPSRTNHGSCIRCHNALEDPPAVERDCAGCHREAEQGERLRMAAALLLEHQPLTSEGRSFRFAHRVHLESLGAEGAVAPETCARCHAGVEGSVSLDQIEPMRMADCLDCHRGLRKELEASSTRLDRCVTCHLVDQTQTAPSLATSFERPLSHTPIFRTRHEDAAESDRGLCQACHLELGGGPGRDCAACHLKLRPRDHGARWREEPHGRAAVRQGPERCAACHARDRCADCHAKPPRDHFPRSAFLVRHGTSAAISVRRCQTCHLPEVDCARCHATQAP